jgi:hypothetical protein
MSNIHTTGRQRWPIIKISAEPNWLCADFGDLAGE